MESHDQLLDMLICGDQVHACISRFVFDEDVWIVFARSFKSNLSDYTMRLELPGSKMEACVMIQSLLVLID